ncbi:MAG: SDR family NAD(P)-dependent oxidoreductase [Alphaproteobacteria bacterium]
MTDETGQLSPQGRVVMVSGANRGIGEAIARRLLADGYSLSLGSRKTPALPDLDGHDRVAQFAFDAEAPADAARWVADTVARFGRLDGLVNNAGVAIPFDFDSEDETNLDLMMEVNVKAPYRLTKAALPHLRAAGTGRVINVSSLSGIRHKGGSIGYSMSKHALMALSTGTRMAAWDDGVRVTTVAPGAVATPMGLANTVVPEDQMIRPATVAALVATALSMPNTASVVTIPVNAVLEPTV